MKKIPNRTNTVQTFYIFARAIFLFTIDTRHDTDVVPVRLSTYYYCMITPSRVVIQF